MNKKLLFGLVLVLLFIPLIQANEAPPLPLGLYGGIHINNAPAPPGTFVEVLDARGNTCGMFTTSFSGMFGIVQCIGYGSVGDVSGSNPNEIVVLRVNNAAVSVLLDNTLASMGPVTWQSGVFKNITLVQPPLICGDTFCDNFESCSSCPQDCGICPQDRPEPPASSPSAGVVGPPDFGVVAPRPEAPSVECVESWSCSNWGICTSENIQLRECVDLNECETTNDIPQIERSCTYVGEAQEEIPDRDLTPRPEQPITITTCQERMPLLGIHSISFIILILSIIAAKLLIKRRRLKKLKENKELEEIKKLEEEYLIKRKSFIFITTISVLSIIVYVYHYFFFLCDDTYHNHLWLLALFVFLSPILIYLFIEIFRYSEKDMARKISLLNDTHYKHVLGLVKIVNKELVTAEAEIANAIYQLDKSEKFKDLLSKYKNLKNVYDDIGKLYVVYKEDKPATKIEKDLLENISGFEIDEEFKKEAEKYPELDKLKYNLAALFKSYEYKQELYNELLKIEEEFEEKQGEEKND